MRQTIVSRALLITLVAGFAAGALSASSGAEQEKAIQSALVEKLGGDAGNIKVAFYDGKVVLSGRVEEDWTQELAKEVALYVPGVTKVENQIEAVKERKVGSGKMIAESGDASLETDVKNALHREIGTYSNAVEIEVCDGVVSLRGTVPDASRLGLAVKTATGVKGVKKVIDLLRAAA
jgi:osmotically-inducible protein OsmY